MSEDGRVNDITQQLDFRRSEVASIQEQIEALKEQLANIKQAAVTESMQAIAACPDRDAMIEVASHIYWFYEDLVAATPIFQYLNIPTNRITDHLYAAQITQTCFQCGKPFSVRVTSRSDLKLTRNRTWATCDDCSERSSREREEVYQQQIDAEAAELARLKAMPYREYLQTPHWQALRQRMLKWAKFRCQVCNTAGVSLQVHHRTYERRGQEEYKDLIVLCAGCHKTFHDNGRLAQ